MTERDGHMFREPRSTELRGDFRIARLEGEVFAIRPRALIDARRAAHLSQEELGLLCGWTRAYICKLEKGHTARISGKTLEKLQQALKKHGIKTDVEAA